MVSTLSEVLADNSPTDPGVAAYAYDFLGFANYKLGKMSKALEMAKKSLEFKEKNATARYNAACYAARLRLIDASLGFLERAIEQDQGRATSANTDADFDPLRQLPKLGSPQERDFLAR